MIPFNVPYVSGDEIKNIEIALKNRKLCGNGEFTKKCQGFFAQRYGFKKCLLTTSGTDALEMCAILAEIKPGDEVIVPSYTFVSSAIAFVRQGAKVVFCDSCRDNPNIDPQEIAKLITPNTKAIVVVHYAGMACDMDSIMDLAEANRLIVIEDAAHAIDSYHIGRDGVHRPLGSIGHLSAFSFHETKNVICGEGGLLVVNDPKLSDRAEIIWEKGTNRSQFFRGVVNKYGWVDIGSSFLPSEILAAYLWSQLSILEQIQQRRLKIWAMYQSKLQPLADRGFFEIAKIPSCATNNAHMFYLVFPHLGMRTAFIEQMKQRGITCAFHYLALHKSDYYAPQADGRALPNCDRYADGLVRLPMYFDLTDAEVDDVVNAVQEVATLL